MAKDFVKLVEGLNLILKVILFLFLGNFIGGIYRICKGQLLFGIIWIFLPGVANVIDLVCILLYGNPKFFV